MAWTTPTNWSASETVTSTKLNALAVANPQYLYDLAIDPPRCDLARNANQAITTNGNVSWDTETVDTDTMWAIGNPTQIIPQTAGRYHVDVNVGFANVGDTTARTLNVQKNGANLTYDNGERRLAENGAITRLNWSGDVVVNGSTDYINVFVQEAYAGGSVNLTGRITVRWVALT